MLKIIDRYFLKLLIIRMFFISLILIAIVWLTKSIQLFQKISEGLAPSLVAKLTLLSMPPFLVEVVPFALFITVIMSWSRLITDRELVVMQATGISHWRMSYPIIFLGLTTTFISIILSVSIVPSSYRQLNLLEVEISQYGHLLLNEGSVTRLSQNQYVYIEKRDGNILKEISIFITDPKTNNQQTIIAKEGIITRNEAGETWVLLADGTRTLWEVDKQSVNKLTFKSYNYNFSPTRHFNIQETIKPREVNFYTLRHPEKNPNIPKQRYNEYYNEFHKRISSPMLSLAYGLMALAWMKSGRLLRQGHGRRILMATLNIVGLRAIIFMNIILGVQLPFLYTISYIIITFSIIFSAFILMRSHF